MTLKKKVLLCKGKLLMNWMHWCEVGFKLLVDSTYTCMEEANVTKILACLKYGFKSSDSLVQWTECLPED